jgi:hypothetical protein
VGATLISQPGDNAARTSPRARALAGPGILQEPGHTSLVDVSRIGERSFIDCLKGGGHPRFDPLLFHSDVAQ